MIALLLAITALTAEAPEKGPCATPLALRKAVEERFGPSRLLKTPDLYEDERKLFVAEHPTACPGMAKGQFFGSTERPAISLVLLDVGEKKDVVLIVARPALATWILVEVDRLAQGSTPVTSRGRSEKPAEKGATAATPSKDVLLLTGYESWQRRYVWNGVRFESVPPKD